MAAKRVRFIEHFTINTKSDHDCLFVHVQIRPRGERRWVDLLLVSQNMGGRFDRADLRRILVTARAMMGDSFVLALQEGGDQPWVGEVAAQFGASVLPGRGPGSASTPTLIGADIEVRRAAWEVLLPSQWIGPGAGPDRNKTKGWNVNRLRVAGVPFSASSIHEIASQQNRRRFLAALTIARQFTSALLARRRPSFVIGDLNSATHQRLVRWMLSHGLTTNHVELGSLATMGPRDIDAVVCAERLVA